MTTLNSNDFTQKEVIKMIVGDSTIQQSIKEAASETPEQEWTVTDIHDLVGDAINMDIDLDDTDLFGSLLAYFNGEQVKQAALLSE
ncbi:MAG: hypothetical protein GJ680_07690 [Alteromonadaceae bacterium]|nr:hypothetical protein [Alteromonadaceae bacterium]